MKLFEDMSFEQKMIHLEKCRLNALDCIANGEPSNLADICDWHDIWGPWLMSEVKSLTKENEILKAQLKYVQDNSWKIAEAFSDDFKTELEQIRSKMEGK